MYIHIRTYLLHQHCVHGLLIFHGIFLHDGVEREGLCHLTKNLVCILTNNLKKNVGILLSGIPAQASSLLYIVLSRSFSKG